MRKPRIVIPDLIQSSLHCHSWLPRNPVFLALSFLACPGIQDPVFLALSFLACPGIQSSLHCHSWLAQESRVHFDTLDSCFCRNDIEIPTSSICGKCGNLHCIVHCHSWLAQESSLPCIVIPGLPRNPGSISIPWIPAFAGMT